MSQVYDTIIIGAGSAWLPAGMYASRYKLSNVIIGELPGGALATSHCVENWPGVFSGTGKSIMDDFAEHARKAGSEILQERVETIVKNGEYDFTVKTTSGSEYQSRTIILATGNKYKKLGVPGEVEYIGQWVSYCATCDGNFFKNLSVAVVGGGNTAITEALYLAEIAREVHILVRTDRVRAEDIWVDKAKKHTNIIFHYFTEVAEIQWGMMGMTGILCKDGSTLTLDGIFIAVGNEPYTSLVDHLLVEKDTEGCLVVDKRQETSVKWLYAAGDVTTGSNKFRQTIMSAAEGCLAANSVHEDILRIGH